MSIVLGLEDADYNFPVDFVDRLLLWSLGFLTFIQNSKYRF
jgi:hypothetical protein